MSTLQSESLNAIFTLYNFTCYFSSGMSVVFRTIYSSKHQIFHHMKGFPGRHTYAVNLRDKIFLILPVLLCIPSLLNSSRHLYWDSVMIWRSPSITPIAGAREKSVVGSALGSTPPTVVIRCKKRCTLDRLYQHGKSHVADWILAHVLLHDNKNKL